MRPGTAFLQGPPVVQTAAYLRHEFFGNVDGKTARFQAIIEDVALVLFAAQTSAAVLAHTRTAAQAERAKNGGAEAARLTLEPTREVGERVRIIRCHVHCVPYAAHRTYHEKQ